MKTVILSLFLSVICVSEAATRYIRAGAVGGLNNGASWANAYTNFASVSWSRTNIYYLAGGDYIENVSITTAESSTNWLIIKKANSSDNSSDEGWSALYESVQAAIYGKFTVSYGYFRLDGVTGSGTTGHGIKIHRQVDSSFPGSTINFLSGTASPRQLYHIDIRGPGFDYGSAGSDGVYFNSTVSSTKGFVVSYCWLHEIPRNGFTFGNLDGSSYSDYGILFENNVVERTGGVGMRYPLVHGQALQFYAHPVSYSIFRNNVFRNTASQANLSFLGGANANYILIYNNVFYSENGTAPVYGIADSGSTTTIAQLYRNMSNYENVIGRTLTNITKGSVGIITAVANSVGGAITMSGGMSGGVTNEPGDEFVFCPDSRATYLLAASIYTTDGNQASHIQIVNNTLYNLHLANINVVNPPDTTGNVAQNNLFVGNYITSLSYCPTITAHGYWANAAGTYDPADTETSSPFIDATTHDFRLKSTANAVGSGTNRNDIFTTDINGTVRGSVWDIGAYQYAETPSGRKLKLKFKR